MAIKIFDVSSLFFILVLLSVTTECSSVDCCWVVPEKLRTLDHGRPWSDDQFASTRLSSNRDMSR